MRLYDINCCLMWRGKVLAQVVESTWFVWEDLGLSPMYAKLCVDVLLLVLKICMMMWLVL